MMLIIEQLQRLDSWWGLPMASLDEFACELYRQVELEAMQELGAAFTLGSEQSRFAR